MTISIRFLFKSIYFLYKFDNRKPTAIYGAGEAGRQLQNALSENLEYKPLFFLDDNKDLQNFSINGLSVYKLDKKISIFKKLNIKVVLLAIPSISKTKRNEIIKKLEALNVEIKTMPSMNNLVKENAKITDISNLSIQEILDREEVPSIPSLMKKNIQSKVVLVTGGGGSIGSELCRQIIKRSPKCIIYLDHSEFALYKIDREIKDFMKKNKLDFQVFSALGSIQDHKFIKRLFQNFKIETVYHAAAFKHVPLVEGNIIEAIKNNVFSTSLLSKIAIKNKVDNFILISSDKAVRPTNFMGATKRLSELICQSSSDQQNKTIFSIVRFGNVMGSSGSVIPLFEEQVKNKLPLTVTHKNISRYFMTIKEAVALVIQAGAFSQNGDLFILDMGKPVKILNLAKRILTLHGIVPKIKYHQQIVNSLNDHNIIITKLRPGEKIYEELLIDNKHSSTKHPRIFKAREKSISQKELSLILNNLENLCSLGDVYKTKDYLEKIPIDFKGTNNNLII
jgi:FlaA1/EpsC-like NDP-sugar epimerase